MTDTLDSLNWQQLVRELKRKKCTPLLSNQIILSDLFAENVISAWANEIGYPLDNHHLTRVAQFHYAQKGDSNGPKDDYLDFLKQRLLEQRQQQWPVTQQPYLDAVEDELADVNVTVSKVVERLGYLNFDQHPDHPLRQLADLDLPLYLTTSHHDFIEMALKSVGKEPQTAICKWYDDFHDRSAPQHNFTPSIAHPLVYHLHGHDSDSPSLVLTEDDHFDFLMAIARNFNQIIPNAVMTALSDSALILLGYQLLSPEFGVTFRGLIKEKSHGRRPYSVSIQLVPEDMPNPIMAQTFVRNYFKGHRFEVYWGDMASFIAQLYEKARR